MENGGTHGEEGSQQVEHAENVVRIPRDWFGPKEELVPFGPRAFQPNVVEPEEEPGRVGGRPPSLDSLAQRDSEPTETEARAPLDPNTFWGEDSSLIHDVVEGPAADCAASASSTPAVRPHVGAAVRRVFSSGRELRQLVGARMLAGATLLLLIVIGSVVAWQLGGSRSGPFRAAVPSFIGQRSQTSVASDARQRSEWPAGHLPRLQEKTIVRSRPHVSRARTVRHTGAPQPGPEASPSPSSPIEATYHPSQSASSAPTTSTHQPPATPASSTTESTSSHGTSAASVASANTTHSSPAAFGATGALGPMSSSDG